MWPCSTPHSVTLCFPLSLFIYSLPYLSSSSPAWRLLFSSCLSFFSSLNIQLFSCQLAHVSSCWQRDILPPQHKTKSHPPPSPFKLTWEGHLWSPAQHHGMCSFVMLSSCFTPLHIDLLLLLSLSSVSSHLIFATFWLWEKRFQSSYSAFFSWKFPRNYWNKYSFCCHGFCFGKTWLLSLKRLKTINQN